MFELNGTFTSEEAPKFALNNLSVFSHEIKNPLTYATFLSKNGVGFYTFFLLNFLESIALKYL